LNKKAQDDSSLLSSQDNDDGSPNHCDDAYARSTRPPEGKRSPSLRFIKDR
jgi:hypothetical protein